MIDAFGNEIEPGTKVAFAWDEGTLGCGKIVECESIPDRPGTLCIETEWGKKTVKHRLQVVRIDT